MGIENRKLTLFTPEQAEGDKPEVENLQLVVDSSEGRIVKAGDPRDVRLWLEAQEKKASEGLVPSFEKGKVEGGAVMAGLTDAHMHPMFYSALSVHKPVYLFGLESKAQVLDALKAAVADKDRPNNKSLVALGLNTAAVPEISMSELREVVGDRRAAIFDASLHGGFVSEAMAKEIERIAKASAEPISGYLSPQGKVTEQHAITAIKVADADCSIEDVMEATEGNLDQLLRSGVTGVHDMLPMTTDHFIASLHLQKKWQQERGVEFPIRRFHLDRLQLAEVVKRLPEIERLGLMDRSEFSEFVGLKLLADGSFGSFTADMSADYDGGKGHGLEYDTAEQMNEAMRIAKEYGVEAIATHAIGDAGIQKAIAAARRWIAGANADFDPKFRIEHFELPLPLKETLKEVRDLGIWVTPQPNFLLDYVYEDRLGERTRWICPHREILDEKVNMMFGTDGMPRSMLFAIYLATHAEEKKQRLTFTEALLASSLTAAQFEKDQRGSLREGNKADIIVADPSLIRELSEGEPDVRQYAQGESANQKVAALESQIRRVYKAGQLVYQRAKS